MLTLRIGDESVGAYATWRMQPTGFCEGDHKGRPYNANICQRPCH